MTTSTSLKSVISGDTAFYNDINYIKNTRKELLSTTALKPICRFDTEHKIIRVAKRILYILLLPIKIYRIIHSIAGFLFFLPATQISSNQDVSKYRSSIELDDAWKYKRITVEVNGSKIDAILMGKESTLSNGRWVLPSLGNGSCYEAEFHDPELKSLLENVNGNALLFNYPGVSASSGVANRRAMTKTYRAMLSLLENDKKGIGAKEIIGYGHSIGGGVQGDALRNHKLKKDVKYVFMKSRTFSSLSKTASSLTNNRFLGFLTWLFGWNIESITSSKKLKSKEIILQTANVDKYTILKDSSSITNDGIISEEASLARAVLNSKSFSKKTNQVCIGIPDKHNDPLSNLAFVTDMINDALNEQTA